MNILLDKAYYKESYEELMTIKKKYTWVEIAFGIVLLVGGVSLGLLNSRFDMVYVILCIVGIFEICSPSIKKYLWLRRQLGSKSAGTEIEVKIDSQGYKVTGRYSAAEIKWDGVEKVSKSSKGFVIWPQKGTYVYIPIKNSSNETVRVLASKCI